jgi:hypothetical protein
LPKLHTDVLFVALDDYVVDDEVSFWMVVPEIPGVLID